MDGAIEQLKGFVGFRPEDAANLRALAPSASPMIPVVVQRFYGAILQDPGASEVLTGGEEQLERLRHTLTAWLEGLFSGVYDDDYYDSRRQIGVTHVRVVLPQKYMPLAIEIVWQQLSLGLRDLGIDDCAEKLHSLHKILMIDLTTMLEGYKDNYSEQIRGLERSTMEAKLSRAEHLAEIGQLAASLAHEIKNPLAGISGAIQVIGDSLGDDSPFRSIVTDILGQISRMDATVKDLLLYGRPSPPNPSPCKLEKLASRVLKMLNEEPALRTKKVEIHDTLSHGVVYADEGQIEQLLVNLIINAAHASDEDGTIRLKAAQRGNRIELTVCDDGTGMPPDVQKRALEPFYTTKAKGTGLGLAICRRIAESNGGTIELSSTLGKGTTVTVTLPCTPRSEPQRTM